MKASSLIFTPEEDISGCVIFCANCHTTLVASLAFFWIIGRNKLPFSLSCADEGRWMDLWLP
jgi:hypothetical protein